jgi:virulence factor Mce-like protein
MRRVRWLPAALVVALAVLVVVLLVGSGDDGGYEVRAEVADASGVQAGFDVRVDGLTAGTVEDVELTRRDTAILTVRLDRDAGEVGRDARLSVRSANLLGERYVDLEPGNRRDPQPSPARVPLSRTSSEVQLDDVFNTLPADTRARLRILVNELGTGLTGRGGDLAALLEEMPPTLRAGRDVLAQVRSENARLGRLIEQASRGVTTLSAKRRDAVRFVADTARLLETADARRDRLGETVRELPGTLRQVRATLDRLETTSQRLRPTARALRVAAPSLADTLRALPGFAAGTSSTLRTARAVAPSLTRLGREGTPDLARVRASLQQLDAFVRATRPLSASLGRGGVARLLLDTMHNWSLAINSQDGLSRVFRLRVAVTTSIVQSLIGRLAPQLGGELVPLVGTEPGSAPDTTDGATQQLTKGRAARGGRRALGVAPDAATQRILDELIGHD